MLRYLSWWGAHYLPRQPFQHSDNLLIILNVKWDLFNELGDLGTNYFPLLGLNFFISTMGGKKFLPWDFPGGPVVKTLSFQCRGRGFDPWSGNYNPTCHVVRPKKTQILSLPTLLGNCKHRKCEITLYTVQWWDYVRASYKHLTPLWTISLLRKIESSKWADLTEGGSEQLAIVHWSVR